MAARFAIIDEMGFVPGGDERGTAADMFRRMIGITCTLRQRSCAPMLHDVAESPGPVWHGFPYLRRNLAVGSKQQILQRLRLMIGEKPTSRRNATHLFRA